MIEFSDQLSQIIGINIRYQGFSDLCH